MFARGDRGTTTDAKVNKSKMEKVDIHDLNIRVVSSELDSSSTNSSNLFSYL